MSNNEKMPPATNLYDSLVGHELAALFPEMGTAEFENLKLSIKEQGILQPITLYDGKILDGRHRYRAGKEVGYKFSAKDFKTFEGTYAEAEAFVHSMGNRRNLSNAQKQDVIRKMILKYPDDGDRSIARKCGMSSHSQVAKVREKMSEKSAEEKAFEGHLKNFKAFLDWAPDDYLAQFSKKFVRELREMVALGS